MKEEKNQDTEDKEDTQEPELFGKDGEDKIGMLLRDKPKLGLRPLLETFPQETSGTDGDLGLNHMVARAERIPLRAQEIQDPVPLIVLQGEEERRSRGSGTRCKDNDG